MKKSPLVWIIRRIRKRIPMIAVMTAAQVGQALFLVFLGVVIWEFSTKKMPFTKLERWCIVSILAGGLGNVIDRVRLGYVIDMIEVDFMEFAIFNVADCFITCGCILLMVSLVFFNKKFWKEESK